MATTPHVADATPPSRVVQDLVGVVLERIPDLTEALIVQILRDDEEYAKGRLDTSELRRSFSDNMTQILRALAGLIPEGSDPYLAPRTTGVYRADKGFPLESVLHTYRLGVEVMWNALLDEARTRPPAVLTELVDYAARLFQLIDRFSLAMVEAYRSREAEIRRFDSERRQAILDTLLEGKGGQPNVLAQAASVLDLPANGRFAVVVAPYDPVSTDGGRTTQDQLAINGIRSLWRVRGDREVGVIRLGEAPLEQVVQRLTSVLHHRAGVSGVVASMADIGAAHQMAELTLQTLPVDSEQVAVFDDRLPEALLVSNPLLAARVARQALGRVLDLDAEERRVLLQTLETWFRCDRSSARAAEQLYCHRNTVLNRLTRIQTLTGGSLEDDRHLLLCRLALVATAVLPEVSLGD